MPYISQFLYIYHLWNGKGKMLERDKKLCLGICWSNLSRMFYIWILFKWDELAIHFFFFLFFGGPWSELLEESESESEADEDEDEDELELSSLSLLLSSDEDEELDESLLSDKESLEEFEESLLLLSELEDLFFFVFLSVSGNIPGPFSSAALFSFSFSFFFNSVVLDGR